MKESKQTVVKVKGAGDSKQKALAAALGSVQRALLENNAQIFLRIEPISVKVISATESTTTEKFLFFFFPRKRRTYQVELEITVEVSFMDVDKIEFSLI